MKIDIDKVKIILEIIEAVFSIWLLYRSGRIVLKKGNTEEKSTLVKDPYAIMIATVAVFLTVTWRMAFTSWILFYCAMIYWLTYMLFDSEWTKRERIVFTVVWLILSIIIPFA